MLLKQAYEQGIRDALKKYGVASDVFSKILKEISEVKALKQKVPEAGQFLDNEMKELMHRFATKKIQGMNTTPFSNFPGLPNKRLTPLYFTNKYASESDIEFIKRELLAEKMNYNKYKELMEGSIGDPRFPINFEKAKIRIADLQRNLDLAYNNKLSPNWFLDSKNIKNEILPTTNKVIPELIKETEPLLQNKTIPKFKSIFNRIPKKYKAIGGGLLGTGILGLGINKLYSFKKPETFQDKIRNGL